MRIVTALALLLSIILAGCTGGPVTATNTLAGNWNVVLTEFNQTTPLYTFGLTLTQTGTTLTATQIAYTGNPGSTPASPAASNTNCLAALTLTGQGTVTGATSAAAQATASGSTITTPSFPQMLTLTLSDTQGTTITLTGTYDPALNLYDGGSFSMTSSNPLCVPAKGQVVMAFQSENL